MELSLQSKFRTKPILDKRYAMIKMEKIKSNSKMSYDRFQELYVEYGEGYEEIFFAYAFLDIEELRYKKSYKEKQSPAMVLTRQAVLENPNYLLELRKNWANQANTVVRISQIETRILQIEGIVDIQNTKINNSASNLTLTEYQVPIFGGVSQ